MAIVLKRRNFQPYVLNWLIPKLDVGTAIGKIFYMAEAGTAMEQKLKDNGIPDSEIYHTLTSAYAATTTGQNDVILIAPGLYVETASVAANHSNTHIVGLGGPNTNNDYTMAGTHIYTVTTSVASTINVTGNHCQFHNFGVSNAGALAANLAAVANDGYNNFFKSVTMQGIMTSQQIAVATTASLIMEANAHNSLFDDCVIGQNQWGERTAAGGHLLFSGATMGIANNTFRNCLFLSGSSTPGVGMIHFDNVNNVDRMQLFDNCHFDNFSPDYAVLCTSIVTKTVQVLSSANIGFRNCSSNGYTSFCSAAQNVSGVAGSLVGSNMTAGSANGGVMNAANAV